MDRWDRTKLLRIIYCAEREPWERRAAKRMVRGFYVGTDQAGRHRFRTGGGVIAVPPERLLDVK